MIVDSSVVVVLRHYDYDAPLPLHNDSNRYDSRSSISYGDIIAIIVKIVIVIVTTVLTTTTTTSTMIVLT